MHWVRFVALLFYFLEFPVVRVVFPGVPRVEVANIAEERTSWKSHRETGIKPGDVVRGV